MFTGTVVLSQCLDVNGITLDMAIKPALTVLTKSALAIVAAGGITCERHGMHWIGKRKARPQGRSRAGDQRWSSSIWMAAWK